MPIVKDHLLYSPNISKLFMLLFTVLQLPCKVVIKFPKQVTKGKMGLFCKQSEKPVERGDNK